MTPSQNFHDGVRVTDEATAWIPLEAVEQDMDEECAEVTAAAGATEWATDVAVAAEDGDAARDMDRECLHGAPRQDILLIAGGIN
jgi:hypothetical protein